MICPREVSGLGSFPRLPVRFRPRFLTNLEKVFLAGIGILAGPVRLRIQDCGSDAEKIKRKVVFMPETTAIAKLEEEYTMRLQFYVNNAAQNMIEAGRVLIDAKKNLGHGRFGPWLREMGISTSTASNWMAYAKEVKPGSMVASLPYSKGLALLGAPEEEREELAAEVGDKSAAEIRKLIEERNRAAEAANTETARADRAEQDAKRFNQENASLRNKIQTLETKNHDMQQAGLRIAGERDALRDENNKLKADLLYAENNRIEVEVEKRIEVAPADYEAIKARLANAEKSAQELIDAAADAEERAAAAEEEVEQLKMMGSGQADEPVAVTINKAMSAFFHDCDMMPFYPVKLQRDEAGVRHCIEQMRDWCRRMEDALQMPAISEGYVV